jgi:protocatechuate 3,4-dioxygenase beta subunit
MRSVRPPTSRAESSRAGKSIASILLALVAAAPFTVASRANDDPATKSAQTAIRGRVLDSEGRAIAGARIRLYRRDSRWERLNPVVEESAAAPDGRFQLTTPLAARPVAQSRGLPPYVLVADHPGKAIGWKIIPSRATAFEGDITLATATQRTITVVDADRHPVSGATVVAYALGDSASPELDYQDLLRLRPADGPLTAVTGADGRATLTQLPRTQTSFVGTKAGFAETYALREHDVIRLTPAGTLSGTITGPGGEPLAGIKVVLHPDFIWEFENAVTDAAGRYRFDGLKARGWDMSSWGSGTPNEANGQYKVWLHDQKFAMKTQSLVVEPSASQTLDIHTVKAGTIRVTLVEEGTEKPVVGATIWGFDAETGSSARFNAYTDAQGHAVFYSAPSRISLSIAGLPEGVFLDGNGHGVPATLEFSGGEEDVTMVMRPIAGVLTSLGGVCVDPRGAAVENATVYCGRGFVVSHGSLLLRRRTDRAGRFNFDEFPARRTLRLYAESADRKLAGTATVTAPEKPDPAFRVSVPFTPTMTVEWVIEDRQGKPLDGKKVHFWPKIGEDEFSWCKRSAEADAQGRVKFDGILPGISYRVQENGPPPGGAVRLARRGQPVIFDEVLVLAPDK